eukprot:9064037-Pyramimonas_sp.AAC.2
MLFFPVGEVRIGHQWHKGRGSIHVAGTNHTRGEGMYLCRRQPAQQGRGARGGGHPPHRAHGRTP